MPIDNVLKLYSETIQSSFLHYGFWDDPASVKIESLTLQDLRDAQLRYIEHLASFFPNNVDSVIDVGCGIGGNTEYLMNKGYAIETLSPDDYQKSVILEKFDHNIKFHHCKFENFNPKKQYDLILQSESACYIKIDEGFKKAREVLRDGGYLLASDYFVYFHDSSNNLHLKSSHNLDQYLSIATKNGFRLIKEYDQTENTMITLDYAKFFIGRFIDPALNYGIYSAQKSFPIISSLISKIIGSKWEKKRKQLDLVDSSLFRKYRKYMIYLLKKI